jgi:hypothetical protein
MNAKSSIIVIGLPRTYPGENYSYLRKRKTQLTRLRSESMQRSNTKLILAICGIRHDDGGCRSSAKQRFSTG